MCAAAGKELRTGLLQKEEDLGVSVDFSIKVANEYNTNECSLPFLMAEARQDRGGSTKGVFSSCPASLGRHCSRCSRIAVVTRRRYDVVCNLREFRGCRVRTAEYGDEFRFRIVSPNTQ